MSKTDDQKEKETALKYGIKSITEYKSAFQLGNIAKEQINHLKLFDKNGLKQKEMGYADGKIENVITYDYDQNGNLIISNAINSDSSFLFKATMYYYENNLRKEVYFYLPDGTYKYRNLSTYNKEGKLVELKYYWPDGLKAQNKYLYKGNNKIEDTEYAPDGTFRYKWMYKYDNNDNLAEAVQYYPGNRINGKTVNEYNTDNLLIRQTNYIGESVQNILTFEYDDKALPSSKTKTTSEGNIVEKFRYHYEFY